MSADEEVLCGPVPCEWQPVNEPPEDSRIVLLCTDALRGSGREGIFMGSFVEGRFRFFDPRLNGDRSIPPVIAWTDFPDPPDWLHLPEGQHA